MEEIAVNVENVSKSFKIKKTLGIFTNLKNLPNSENNKIIRALEGVSLQVPKGQVLGIIGLNGSGKTTLLRLISGIYSPDHGSVKVQGKLSPLLQLGAGFQGDLNAQENIIMNGMLLGLSKSDIQQRIGKIIEFAELEKFSNLKLKHYSTGMRVRLAFSTAVQINPDILLVDEIIGVGDKDFRQKSYETFLSFKKNGKTILHATHNLVKLAEFSDRVLLLHKGKKVMIGEPKEVIQKYQNINL